MTAAALLLAALLAAPAPVDPEAAPSPPAAARAGTLVVRARGLDDVALQAALRPRSGGAAVVLLRDVASVDPDHTFVDVELQPPELAVTIILRDGRVFVRRARADGPRDAARLIASMLAAIEGDALAPLPGRAVSPALAEAPPEPVPRDIPEPPPAAPLAVPVPPAPVPQDMSPPPPKPVPQDMSLDPDPPPAPRAAAAPPVSKDRRLRLDLGLAGAPLFGLGRPGPGLRGGAGELRLDLLGARVWLITAGLRAAGHSSTSAGALNPEEKFGLARLRVSLGAGARLVRGRFELRASANLSVEPWLVTRAGRRVRPGESTGPAPLLGGHVRITPAFAVTSWLALGLFAELAASAAPSGNVVRVRLGDVALFHMGGVEASVGLELRARMWPKPTKQR